MSRLFSMTRSTSDAMMFMAATITMRPMVIEMAIFSSHSAENRAPFRSAQSCAMYSGPSRSGIESAISCAANMSSTRNSMKSGASLPSAR